MNGLLRDYFPKGTDLSTHPPQHLLAVENELNHRPRQVLNDRTPTELFAALLASESPPVFATLTRTCPVTSASSSSVADSSDILATSGLDNCKSPVVTRPRQSSGSGRRRGPCSGQH
jgi:hypothetical protein